MNRIAQNTIELWTLILKINITVHKMPWTLYTLRNHLIVTTGKQVQHDAPAQGYLRLLVTLDSNPFHSSLSSIVISLGASVRWFFVVPLVRSRSVYRLPSFCFTSSKRWFTSSRCLSGVYGSSSGSWRERKADHTGEKVGMAAVSGGWPTDVGEHLLYVAGGGRKWLPLWKAFSTLSNS